MAMRTLIKLAAIAGLVSTVPLGAALADTSINDEAAAAAAPQHFPPVVLSPGDPAVVGDSQIASFQPLLFGAPGTALIDEEPGQSPNETAAEEAMTPAY
jgi:hypothetical protein